MPIKILINLCGLPTEEKSSISANKNNSYSLVLMAINISTLRRSQTYFFFFIKFYYKMQKTNNRIFYYLQYCALTDWLTASKMFKEVVMNTNFEEFYVRLIHVTNLLQISNCNDPQQTRIVCSPQTTNNDYFLSVELHWVALRKGTRTFCEKTSKRK